MGYHNMKSTLEEKKAFLLKNKHLWHELNITLKYKERETRRIVLQAKAFGIYAPTTSSQDIVHAFQLLVKELNEKSEYSR